MSAFITRKISRKQAEDVVSQWASYPNKEEFYELAGELMAELVKAMPNKTLEDMVDIIWRRHLENCMIVPDSMIDDD